MKTHVHAGGIVGGYPICDGKGGNLVNDADKSDCVDCISKLRDYCKARPGQKWEDEVKRACANVGLTF